MAPVEGARAVLGKPPLGYARRTSPPAALRGIAVARCAERGRLGARGFGGRGGRRGSRLQRRLLAAMSLRAILVLMLTAAPALAQQPTDPAPPAPRAPLASAPPAAGPMDTAWAYDIRYPTDEQRTFLSFRLDSGEVSTDGPDVLAPDGSLIQGCDFDDADLARLVCITSAGLLFGLDLATGDVAAIGSGDYPAGVTDLTYSVADDAWYALVSDCGGAPAEHRSSLARVDPSTGSAVVRAPGTETSFCGLTLAAAPDGALYTYSAETSAAISRTAAVDPESGAFDVLGVTGLDVFYAQSMDCDASDGLCYAFAYSGSGVNGLFLVSPETGAFSPTGDLPVGAELSAGAIATTTAMTVSTAPAPADGLALRVLSALPAARTLRLWADAAGPDATLAMYDALGRLVALHERADGGIALDVSGWAPGVYVARLTADGVAVTRTVTVAR